MSKIMRASVFGELVQTAKEQNDISYIEAVLHVCEEQGFDPEDVAGLIPQYIRDQIEPEALRLKMIKPSETVNIMKEFGEDHED